MMRSFACKHKLERRLNPNQSNAQGGARSHAGDGVWRNGFAVRAHPHTARLRLSAQ